MAKGIIKLGTDSRGNYQRDIGWETRPSGKIGQHRFYFGTNQTLAQIRCLSVQRCWEAVGTRWGRLQPGHRGERPLWDKLTVAIAVAVAGGQEEFLLEPEQCWCFGGCPDAPDVAASYMLPWFRQLQEDFSVIRFRQVGDWPYEAIDRLKRAAKQRAELATRMANDPVVAVGQTLHQALDVFGEWYGQHYRTPDGLPTQHAIVCQKQLAIIKDHSPDKFLEAFGLDDIEGLIRYWQQRPASKAYATKGQPVSRETVKNMIKRIRHFIRWLHKSSVFAWRKPEDYQPEHVRINLTQAERARKVSTTQVPTYSVDELVTLWRYASPRERLFLVLALNCGFGQAEIASLQQAEVFINQPHGHYPITASFIRRLRAKSDVYGEWKLWDVTERALAWWAEQRPETVETTVLVTKTGKALTVPTKGNNRNARIAGAWVGLTKRIRKDQPSFPAKSFNKLRKTSGDLVRRKGGGEMLAIFHSREKTVAVDDQAERYTNRPFDKLFDLLDHIRIDLAPVFDAVVDPFPFEGRKRNPSISLGVREQIIQLRKDGRQYREIAKTCDVSIDTVRRYLKDAGLVRRYRTKV